MIKSWVYKAVFREAISMSQSEKKCCSGLSGKELMIGSIIGGIVGGVTALLLAPKSGEETRRDLHVKDLVSNGVDKVKQAASTLVKKDEEPYS